MKRILFVRHGQSEINLRMAAVVGGQSNSSPLTPLGEQQAACLGRHLRRHLQPHASPALAASSTAVRARDTARLALAAVDPPLPPGLELEEDEALLELDQGEWEGAPRADCYTPAALASIAADPWRFAAPGGESQADLEARVAAYVETRLLPRLAVGGPPAVVFSHGLAIKCFLRGVLGSEAGMTWKIRLDNTGLVSLGWVEAGPAAGWHLLRVNDTGHLDAEGVQY
ncbi:MAG: histidine phosphatase superfamily [Monoraphidium minutum]|nr:MAG: histidine phosphatase superfamily [Monoraphidium minutum]